MNSTNPHHELFEPVHEKDIGTDRSSGTRSPLSDKDSLRYFDSLNLNTFEDIPYAMEEFLESIELTGGPTTLADAIRALDAAASSFAAIDTEHDFVMSKKDLEDYLSEPSRGQNVRPLSWLIRNFSALERLSFFRSGISRNEIEAARDVVHGLSYIDSKIDSIVRDEPDHVLTAKAIARHIHRQRANMDEHEARGIDALIRHRQIA